MSAADPFTLAWEEAEASSTPGVDIYDCLELIHPAFYDSGLGQFSIRAVTGTTEDQTFTHEDGATLNGGEAVVYKAINFTAEHPEFAEGTTPKTKVVIDGVGEEVMPYLEVAVASRNDMIAVWRQYRSDDTSEPCYGPIEFRIKKITASSTRLEGDAMLENLANLKFPNKVFTFDKFPGLLNG